MIETPGEKIRGLIGWIHPEHSNLHSWMHKYYSGVSHLELINNSCRQWTETVIFIVTCSLTKYVISFKISNRARVWHCFGANILIYGASGKLKMESDEKKEDKTIIYLSLDFCFIWNDTMLTSSCMVTNYKKTTLSQFIILTHSMPIFIKHDWRYCLCRIISSFNNLSE